MVHPTSGRKDLSRERTSHRSVQTDRLAAHNEEWLNGRCHRRRPMHHPAREVDRSGWSGIRDPVAPLTVAGRASRGMMVLGAVYSIAQLIGQVKIISSSQSRKDRKWSQVPTLRFSTRPGYVACPLATARSRRGCMPLLQSVLGRERPCEYRETARRDLARALGKTTPLGAGACILGMALDERSIPGVYARECRPRGGTSHDRISKRW